MSSFISTLPRCHRRPRHPDHRPALQVRHQGALHRQFLGLPHTSKYLTLDPCGKAALIRDSRRSRRSADVRVRMPESQKHCRSTQASQKLCLTYHHFSYVLQHIPPFSTQKTCILPQNILTCTHNPQPPKTMPIPTAVKYGMETYFSLSVANSQPPPASNQEANNRAVINGSTVFFSQNTLRKTRYAIPCGAVIADLGTHIIGQP